MATYMMEAKTLPPKFWAKDIKCASYIQNRVPHKNIDGFTPFKYWNGHKPDVGDIYPPCTVNLVNLTLLNHYPKFY